LAAGFGKRLTREASTKNIVMGYVACRDEANVTGRGKMKIAFIGLAKEVVTLGCKNTLMP
jgi:hypothetical protein